ncbi:MAG: hypothetical protein JWO38_1577 [Gemmataceae bacterium]|nr:hypothetical protein [Gemmataceae bacterium]
MRHLFGLISILIIPVCSVPAADEPADRVQYDFEAPADVKAWSNLEPAGARDQEPPARIEQSTDHATAGKHTLKLTFAGGRWPTVTTDQVTQDWLSFKTFKADVTVGRSCVVGFTLLQEKSRRGEGWDPAISRWTKTAFLKPGKNEVVAPLPGANDYAVHARWGKAVRFEIFMYSPHEGESIHVDNIRLGNDKLPPQAKMKVAIQGTDWTVSGTGSADACRELGRNVAHLWNKPEAKTIEQVEDEFRAHYDGLKKRYPRAVLAVLRDGEKGYDPAQPDKVYSGWKDAYWNSHGPDSEFATRATNRGRDATHEIFMRHRSPLMRVDLAGIPTGSTVLAAQLVVVRSTAKPLDEHDAGKRPTLWVVEPCNRPWEEYEVNAFEYARDKFWKEIGGFHRGEDDPDFLPVFLAYGPGRPGKVNTWEFTQAVRFWTDGKNANHGFMLHGDAGDYMTAYAREAVEIKNRPAVLVVYVPK